jgi:hypothetical protein
LFNVKYPNCDAENPINIGDGICHGGQYNTEGCHYDGGDCLEFNKKYPNCTTDLLVDASRVGNGYCTNELNSAECGWDDGDCVDFNTQYPNCKVDLPYRNGDGLCTGLQYNVEECGWDDGDCLDFNEKYPNCTSYGDMLFLVGNGHCDDSFNVEDCGWDGGDCV